MPTESLETEILAQCPCCGSSDTRHGCYASDLLLTTTDQTYEYHRCHRCRVLFLRVRPQESEAGRAYPSDYHPYSNDQSRGDPLEKARSAGRLARIASGVFSGIGRLFNARRPRSHKALGKGDVFLDFGCGSGKFLDRMRERGCATIGMDFSPHALAAVERKGHVALPVSDLGWQSVPLNSVDFVRMNHVVEHLYRAPETLAQIHARTKIGGTLHVAVPNPNGISAHLFGRYWHGLDCPRHVILYPPAALGRLLEESGFSVTSIVQETLTKDHVRSWVYRIQAAGWLRGRNPDDFMDRRFIQTLVAVPMLIASIFGKSDRFHVVARRDR